MVSQDISRQKEIKKKKIVDSAVSLFIEKGYHDTSVKEIVELAKVSVGSFYFYFTSKEELFETLYDEMNEIFLNVLENSYSTSEDDVLYCLCMAVVNTLLLFQKKQQLSNFLLNSSITTGPNFEIKRRDNNKKFYKIVEGILSSMQKGSLVRCENIKIAAMSIMGGIYFLITNLIESSFKETLIPQYSYSIIAYNLRALNVEFNKNDLINNINKIISEEENI